MNAESAVAQEMCAVVQGMCAMVQGMCAGTATVPNCGRDVTGITVG